MRLKEFQIRHVCQKILLSLRTKQLIILKRNENEILNKMVEIFTADLKVEDTINQEVEQLLEQHLKQAKGPIDRQRMFQLIKKQLIKDRNIVV